MNPAERSQAQASQYASAPINASHSTAYWQGIILSDAMKAALQNADIEAKANDQLQKVAGKLMHGNIKGASLEKLYGSGLLCVRGNREDRFLCATVNLGGVPYLVFMEYINNHAYDKSQYEDKTHVEAAKQEIIQAYEQDPETFLAQRLILGVEEKVVSEQAPAVVMSHYRHNYIELDDEQQCLLGMQLPAIVNGSAGSGKSCVAYMFLLNQAQAFPDEKFVYITKNRELADDMRKNWMTSHDVPVQCRDNVTFIDYKHFIEEFCAADLVDKRIFDKSDFMAWMSTSKEKISDQMTADIMYQEFQIMVACDSDAAYLNIGKKNSLLGEALKREVCVCYHRYQRYLEAQKAVDLRFFKASAKAAVCGKMVVDEAQDFSRLELDLLVMAAENNQLGFFMDTNQSLQESLTIRPYLSRMLAERTRGAVTHYDLKVTYRNSQAVANLANAVLKIKNVVLHGVVDNEVEYLEMLTAKTTQGGTEWVESNDEKKLARLKLLAARPNCVVIVPDAKMRDEAIARLETPLVFTISEIKGLEFEHVIVYHFLNQPVFDEIEEFLPEQIDAEKVYPNQPKTRENIEFNTAFAKLFTAVTRAGQSCYLVEPKNHRQQKLSHYLKSKMQTPALPAVESVENKDPKEWADMAAILIRKGDLPDLLAARDIMQKKLGLAVPGMDKPLTASALLWVLNGKSKVDEPNELVDAVSSAPAKKTEKQRNGKKQEKSQSQLKSGSVKQVPQTSAKPIPSKSVSSKQLPPAQQRTEDEKYLDDFIKNMPANLPNFMKLDRVRGNAILHKTKLKSGMTLAEYIVNNPRQLFGDAFGAKAGWVAFANVCLEDGLFAKDFREFLFTCPGKAKILQTITIKHLRNGVQLFAGRTVPLLMCLLMASSCEPLRYIIKDRPDLIKEINLQDLTNKHISCDLSILQNILDEINYHAIGRDFLMALLELNIGTKNGINPSVFLASMHFCTYMFDRDVWSFCDEQLVKLDKDLQVFREICRKIPSLTKKITTKDIGANSPMMVDSYRGHTLLSLLLSPTKEHYKSSFNLLDLMFDKYPEYLRDQAITRHLLAEKVDPLFATTYMHLFLHRKNSPVFYKMISYNPNLLDDLTLNRLLCEDSKGYSILYLMMWSVAGMKIFNAILDRNPAVVRGMTIEQLCSGERYKCESGEFPITFINIFSEECRVVGIPIFDKLFKLNPDLYKSIPSWYWAMLLRNNDGSLPVIDQSLAADLQQTQWGREVVAGLAAKLGVSLPARPAQASDGSEEKSDESSATDRASQQVGASSRFFAPVQATENPPSTTASMPHKNQPR